jgi:ribonucleoside-diphosphate reductase alpha chain
MTYTYKRALRESTDYFNGNELAAKVFVDKYALRDKDKQLLELTPTDMHRRIARELARVEASKFGSTALSEDEIFGYLDQFKYIVPQGSPMFGIGNPNFVTLSNCYVIDPPLDSYGGIMWTDEQIVQISKRRGGCGTDISHLRPNGTSTKNSSRSSTGPVCFANRFSHSVREVGQDGRRGALMLTLSVHHPDVVEFAQCKSDKTKVTGANISIRLSDEFLQAVEDDDEYEQRWPVDSDTPKISRRVKARKVWDAIIKNAHADAEPGLLFWDKIISESPADCYEQFETVSTNPCCFDVNSRVMVITNNGIKEIKDVTAQDKIWINETQEFVKTSGYFVSGTAHVYTVELSNGETLRLTGNHKLCDATPKRVDTKIQYIESQTGKEVSDLRVGDKIMVHTSECYDEVFHGSNTYEEGLIFGWLAGDGCLSYKESGDAYPTVLLDFWKNDAAIVPHIEKAIDFLGCQRKHEQKTDWEYKTRISCSSLSQSWTEQNQQSIWQFRSHNKDIPYLYQSSVQFLRGFISAYFSADGTVTYNPQSSQYGISLASINKQRLHQISYILATFGIKSSVRPMGDGGQKDFGDGYGPYDCLPTHRLIITGVDNIKKFAQHFTLYPENKATALQAICQLQQQYQSKGANYTKVVKITKEEQPVEVGCINVDKYHKFTANGIISFNSELPLSVLDSCRLLLLNTLGFVDNAFEENAEFNWRKFYDYVRVAQRLMDDIVDLELESIQRIIDKITADEEPDHIKSRELELWRRVYENCERGRRTGTGLTALGDTLAALGIPYGSDRALRFTERLYRTLKFGCYQSSIELSEELEPFPAFNADLEGHCPFFHRFYDEVCDLGDETLSGAGLMKRMMRNGRRNIACMTSAPAGSTSMETQTTSGIEPLYFITIVRRKKGNPGDDGFRSDFVDDTGDHWMEFETVHPQVQRWMDVTGETDITKSPWHGNCAEDLDWSLRVKLQATAQQHVDHAISSTVNIPQDATVADVKTIYEAAWREGCKGITVYRKGCRDGVILEKKGVDKPQTDAKIDVERPRSLRCDVHHTSVKGQSYFVLVGLLDNVPYEVFAGKNGFIPKNVQTGEITRKRKNFYVAKFDGTDDELSPITAATTEMEEVVTRLTSLSLRSGADMHRVVQQLEKVGERQELHSFARGIARILKKYIPDGTHEGEQCPECHAKGDAVIRQEGCVKCTACGWSKCI